MGVLALVIMEEETAAVDTNFVVYGFYREDWTPFYIGKGRPDRPYKKGGRPCNSPPPERILILYKNIDEQTAFNWERKLIKRYGRKDLDPINGLLANRSDGGEGSSGVIVSEETRKKMSESRLGDKNYNYKPRDWYHPEHGEVLKKSPREMCEMFPDMNLNEGCLGNVYRREKTNHKGWRRLDDKDVKYRRRNNISRDWYHEEHVVVKNKSLTELVEMFPDHGLSRGALSLVANGKNIHHKRWYLFENKNKKRQNYKPVDWYHPVYGVFLQKTGPELISLFPDQHLDNKALNRVSIGKVTHHKGWRIYNEGGDNPTFVPKHNKYKPIDWYHPVFGVVKEKSLSELRSAYPEENLHLSCLSQVANKKLKQHKGWTLLE